MNPSTAEAVLFWVLAIVMVAAASGLLFARKAVHAAMSVVLVMICLAFLYVTQGAPFLGVVQVVVYTGAVMMLFLFVLMLVGVDASDSLVETIKAQRWIGWIAGIGLAVVLVGVLVKATYPEVVGLDAANADGNPTGVARIIFGEHVFGLEVVGALLVIAALGALVLTHRTRLKRLIKQPERQAMRMKAGTRVTPLPAPGVYARHNAMDVPALDPRGNPIEDSVPRVLRIRGQEAGTTSYHADTYRRAVTAVADSPDDPAALLGTEESEAKPPAAAPGHGPGPITEVDLGAASTKTETEP